MQKNLLIYASPDTTVCECCKPPVPIKGNNVYVMFRNWLNGKLGNGTWGIKGRPNIFL